jgi:hypothetical protein
MSGSGQQWQQQHARLTSLAASGPHLVVHDCWLSVRPVVCVSGSSVSAEPRARVSHRFQQESVSQAS